jgi:phosphate:Na+ symporter
MGQNIGTCITPVLASIGASKNAKRSAFVHATFNVIGTILFLIGIYTFQYFVGFSFWNDPIDKGGIANFHTIFNVTVTACLIPLASLLEKLANICIKEKKEDHEDGDERDEATLVLDERFFVSPVMAIAHAKEATELTASLACKNVRKTFKLLTKFDRKACERAREIEDVIDKFQSKVESYLIKVTEKTLTESESIALSEILQVLNEFERIGDHADNICDCAVTMNDGDISFSENGIEELTVIFQAVEEILGLATNGYKNGDAGTAQMVEPLEEVIDMLVKTVKERHTERLKQGECSLEAAFPFVEVLSSLERIADHCSNVGIHLLSYHSEGKNVDRHGYLREMRQSKNVVYLERFNAFDKKYFDRISQSVSIK